MKTRVLRAFAAGALLISATLHGQQVPSIIKYQGRVVVGGINFNGSGQFKFALVDGGTSAVRSAAGVATVAAGVVTGVSITNGGAGFTIAPALTFSGGGGSGAAANTSISGGVVTAITMTNGGSGYGSAPTVSIAPPPASLFYQTYWSNNNSSSGGSEPTAAVTLPVTHGLYSALLGDTTLPNMSAVPASVFSSSDVRLRVWFNDGIRGFQRLTPDQRIAAVGYAMVAGSAATVNDAAITAQKIASGAALANLNASGQSAVPSGGLILSMTENPSLANAGYQKIGSVVLNDFWQSQSWQAPPPPTSGSPPTARADHTVIWTGNRMIVWGGTDSGGQRNDGAAYDPATNSWTAITTSGAPDARSYHSAIWTGEEMIVWGGFGGENVLNNGGRYNLRNNTWTPITTTWATAGRWAHTAVWTGSEMIVWGGNGATDPQNTGARYNPATSTWSNIPATGAPTARYSQTAVWTGSEMLVWGGFGASGT